MPNKRESHYFNDQMERYLSQVTKAFAGFVVKDGVQRDGEWKVEKVPVVFGSPSRVVAAVLSNDKKFRNVKVPIMGINLTGVELDVERNLNRFHKNYIQHKNEDGEYVNTVRIPGPAIRLNIDLNVMASSVSQLMEIFEQIVLTFNPEVVIQKSTNPHDPDYITSIRLEGINNEITAPLGQNSRVAEMTFQFSVPVNISYPHKTSDPLEEIRLRVLADEQVAHVVSIDVATNEATEVES